MTLLRALQAYVLDFQNVSPKRVQGHAFTKKPLQMISPDSFSSLSACIPPFAIHFFEGIPLVIHLHTMENSSKLVNYAIKQALIVR